MEESLDPCTSAHRRATSFLSIQSSPLLCGVFEPKYPQTRPHFVWCPRRIAIVGGIVCVPQKRMRITFTSCHYCLGVAGPQDVRREMQSRVTEAPAASHKPARGAAMSADAAFLQIRILPPVRTWRIPALPTNNATSVVGICLSGYQQQSPLFGSGNDLCSVRVEMAQ